VRITLQNALRANRLHHALLFTGPRGTGKTSTARILAKSLRCPNAKDYVPCNVCPECQEISSGRSLNVIEIDGASNNGVDAIRDLRETVGYLPSSGKYKLYIIDEVHMLSTSAFNALLKTLEEPPEPVYFVMATTEIHKIPNTILSRCQRFDFRRIPTRTIMQHLQTICEKDQIPFEADALWIIARQGDGSMRDAQSLLDQTINFTNGDLKRDLVVSTLGLTDRLILMDILAAILNRDTAAVVGGLSRLQTAGGDGKLFLLDLMQQVRHALVLKLSQDVSLVDLPDSEREELLRMGASRSQEDLHLLFDMCLKGAQDLARATDPALVLEMVLLRMSHAPTVGSFSTVGSTAPSTQAKAPRNHAPVGQQNPPPTEQPAATAPTPSTVNASPTDHRYKELVEKIKEVNGLIGAQLENCFVVRMEQKLITLGVATKHKFLFDKINHPDFKRKVGNYINTFWGPGYSMTVILAEPGGMSPDTQAPTMSPKVLSEKIEDDRQTSIRKSVEAHPLVQTAQSVFKTEIRSIKDDVDGHSPK
jgi:DNA polymerase-3 subunit gamma/tau